MFLVRLNPLIVVLAEPRLEVCNCDSRRMCGRADRVTRWKNASPGGEVARHGRDRRAGSQALSNNTPEHLPAGSEVANLCLLGYDPDVYFTGRAPLEAAAQGITLGPNDWAIRCNLVTIEDQTMVDFTADHISTDEATELLKSAQQELLSDVGLESRLEFVPGVSYRNLLIYRGVEGEPAPFARDTRSSAPHDLTDMSVADDFPRGPGSDLLVRLMNGSADLFAQHPVNKKRIAEGKRPATNVWLWGLGGAPSLPSVEERLASEAS